MISIIHAWRITFAAIVLVSVSSVFFDKGSVASAAEINVLSASGMREVMTELHAALERAAGQRVTMSFAEAGDLRRRIREGEVGDVIVLPRVVLDQVVVDGNIVPGTTVNPTFRRSRPRFAPPPPGLVHVFMKAFGERPSRARSLRCNAVSSGSNCRTTRLLWQSR